MAKILSEQVIQNFISMGFDRALIIQAWDKCQYSLIDTMISIKDQSENYISHVNTAFSTAPQQQRMQEVIYQSMLTAEGSVHVYTPEKKQRKTGTPVGLRNLGNTCYFNCLLQIYFNNREFVKQILSFVQNTQHPSKQARILSSVNLVKQLKSLFLNLVASRFQFADPTGVLKNLVDDLGKSIDISQQKDIGELNLLFLSRIQDGLSTQKKMEERNQSKDLTNSKILASIKSMNMDYFGILNNKLIYEGGMQRTQDQMISSFFLDIKNHDIYSSIESALVNKIQNYKCDDGLERDCTKFSFIKNCQDFIFFQLNRVQFDKMTSQPRKINSLFDFPLVLSMGRFLTQNQKEFMSIKSQVDVLRKQLSEKSRKLSQILNYQNSGIKLTDVFALFRRFLTHQIKDLNMMEEQSQELSLGRLDTYKQNVQIEQKQLQKQIEALKTQIQTKYIPLNSNPYHLQAVIIHQGAADYGHYYCYVRQFGHNRYVKYNDLKVSFATEEEMIQHARGGPQSNRNAYYLLYVRQQRIDNSKRNYSLPNEPQFKEDSYFKILNEENKVTLAKEQSDYLKNVFAKKAQSHVQAALQFYTTKFQMTNQLHRELLQKNKNVKMVGPMLANPMVFVKNQQGQEKFKSFLYQHCIARLDLSKQERTSIEAELKVKMKDLFNQHKCPSANVVIDYKNVLNNFEKAVRSGLAIIFVYTNLKAQPLLSLAGLPVIKTSVLEYFTKSNQLLCKLICLNIVWRCERNKASLDQNKKLLIPALKIAKENNKLYNTMNVWINEIFSITSLQIESLLNSFLVPPPDQCHQFINQRVNNYLKSEDQRLDLINMEINSLRADLQPQLKPMNKLWTSIKQSIWGLTYIQITNVINSSR